MVTSLRYLVALAVGLAASPAWADGRPDEAADRVLADDAEEVTGEIAVDLADDLAPSEMARLESQYGLTPNSPYSVDHDHLERALVPVDQEAAILDQLSHEPGVEHAEPMEVLRGLFVPDDPLYQSQWHMKRVGAEAAWEFGCGRGVTVAVVDTGVACFDKGPFSRGTDLAGTRCEGGYNFVSHSSDAYDDQGHGTHVAGTVAQTTNNGKGTAGLAFCATLMPVKVLNRYGWGTLANVAEGIRFAADHGAQVVNLSLGGPRPSRILEDAVTYAASKGVVVVAAAGNSGRAVGYPAAYRDAIAVSATDVNDNIAWFSSRGPQVAIAAPGVGVVQQTICEGGRNKCELFGTFNGTSMASPHVAGAAALLMGLGVTDRDAVQAGLTGAARSETSSAAPRDPNLFGAGILDASAALQRTTIRRIVVRAVALLSVLLWIWRRIRRRRRTMSVTVGSVFGAVTAGIGVFAFAPWLGLLPRLGRFQWLGEMLARPFGEWDLAFTGTLHRFLPLANALPVVAGLGLLFGVRSLRSTLGGFAAGMTALLLQLAWSLDVAVPFGGMAARIWFVANAAICLWLARICLERQES
jgi:serine protease